MFFTLMFFTKPQNLVRVLYIRFSFQTNASMITLVSHYFHILTNAPLVRNPYQSHRKYRQASHAEYPQKRLMDLLL